MSQDPIESLKGIGEKNRETVSKDWSGHNRRSSGILSKGI